ncbi:unnamed protein product, partial [Ectocarpus sp. 4 AP-2014]
KKNYPCTVKGCGAKLSTSSSLVNHLRTHAGEKNYHCPFKDCGAKLSTSSSLARHLRTHTGEKNYHCPFEGCGANFSRSDALKNHICVHNGQKNYHCTFEGCEIKCTQSSALVAHMRTHTNERPNHCTFDGCQSSFARPDTLRVHLRMHLNDRPFHCTFEGCNAKFVQLGNLKSHAKTHTVQGQIRRKKQENRVHELLKKWGYTPDVEVTINASQGACVTDTQRYVSRLDFVVVNCVKAVLIVEVDEDQHNWYNLSCEFSRMSDVRISLLKAGYELPIYWIRYNPNGKFHVNGTQIKMHRPAREVALKSKLEELCHKDFVPTRQVNVHYMYYDLV